MRKVICQFTRPCAETGEEIPKGSMCYCSNDGTGQVFALNSKKVQDFLKEPEDGDIKATEEAILTKE